MCNLFFIFLYLLPLVCIASEKLKLCIFKQTKVCRAQQEQTNVQTQFFPLTNQYSLKVTNGTLSSLTLQENARRKFPFNLPGNYIIFYWWVCAACSPGLVEMTIDLQVISCFLRANWNKVGWLDSGSAASINTAVVQWGEPGAYCCSSATCTNYLFHGLTVHVFYVCYLVFKPPFNHCFEGHKHGHASRLWQFSVKVLLLYHEPWDYIRLV